MIEFHHLRVLLRGPLLQLDIHLDNQIKRAQDDEYKLKKVTFQFLWDRTKDTTIPDHASLYTNEGRGQGAEYINNYLSQYQLEEDTDKEWDKIRHNEVYIWKAGTNDIGEEGVIVWDMPIVPVKDTLTNPAVNDMLNASSKDRTSAETRAVNSPRL